MTVPPIKCQGIKTKLIDFIARNILWDGSGRWIEPFLGSGVVLFNIRPRRAIAADVNPHIIRFYKALYERELTPEIVKDFLTSEGAKLAAIGERYYYEVRDRFNEDHAPLDFLFLSRAGFNGMMRFNRSGAFNVPFCRKPERFRKSYVTRIVNQVAAVQRLMEGVDWEFRTATWQETLSLARPGDFVYLDPPYVGRSTDYYSRWSQEDSEGLARAARALPCGFALSMWKENRYRRNGHLDLWESFTVERTFSHFYHVGPTEELRNAVIEALLIKTGYEAEPGDLPTWPVQLSLSLTS